MPELPVAVAGSSACAQAAPPRQTPAGRGAAVRIAAAVCYDMAGRGGGPDAPSAARAGFDIRPQPKPRQGGEEIERVTEDEAGREPSRMEIELSVPGMDPAVNAAMRAQIKDGLRRWKKVRPQAGPFVKKAASQPPDKQTRNQHFISQFWLRRFAGADEVAVLDVGADPGGGLGAPVPVEEAAARSGLFTLRPADGSAHESRMSHIEGKASAVFEKMAAGALPEDDFERFAVAAYLAFIFLQSPVTRHISDDQAEERIEKLAREIKDELGADLSDFCSLDDLKRRYTLPALLDRRSLINKAVWFFFCRSWRLIEMPAGWPLALPMCPVVHWGQGLQPAPEIWVPVTPARLLCMSWIPLPDDVPLTGGQAARVLAALIRHADVTGGEVIVHPDHRDRWKQLIKEHQADNG